jgi:hypothetical protein
VVAWHRASPCWYPHADSGFLLLEA